MTTTEAAIRDLTASLVLAIVPLKLASSRFVEHKYEMDFTDWAAANPDSCFRRFSVLDTLNESIPEVTNTDVDWHVLDMELMVAYPKTNRAGSAAARNMAELIRSDMTLLEKTVGPIGAPNYSGVAAFIVGRASTNIQQGNATTIVRMTLPYGFYRSMP